MDTRQISTRCLVTGCEATGEASGQRGAPSPRPARGSRLGRVLERCPAQEVHPLVPPVLTASPPPLIRSSLGSADILMPGPLG
jgi:hypothetical protein